MSTRFHMLCSLQSVCIFLIYFPRPCIKACMMELLMVWFLRLPLIACSSCMCRYHHHAYGLGEHYNSVIPKKWWTSLPFLMSMSQLQWHACMYNVPWHAEFIVIIDALYYATCSIECLSLTTVTRCKTFQPFIGFKWKWVSVGMGFSYTKWLPDMQLFSRDLHSIL